jgi:hypothetical protein
MNPNSNVKVHLICARGHETHHLCVAVKSGVPPELRCEPGPPSGVSASGQAGCAPADLQARVTAELRDNFQECKRRGFVEIRM